MKRELLDALNQARADKRAVALVTSLAQGYQQLVDPTSPPADLEPALLEGVQDALRSDRSRSVQVDGDEYFVHAFNPPLRLIVVGAVHITQVLAPMALLAGYQVVVVDPRRSFASADRFPGVELNWDWPDEALEALAPDTRTAVVTLTHDPKLDDPALHAALGAPVFYIGCLGSTRTHARRLERLREAGFDEPALARIHGPVGLDIGARSPAEIALAILGQVTSRLRGGRVA